MASSTDSIYLDHAATSPLRPAVLSDMMPLLREEYGNPSSVHGRGRRARHAVESARERVAAVLGVEPGNIVFTSGGTEADNAVILGGRNQLGLMTSRLEHDAILAPASWLETQGVLVRFIEADAAGKVASVSLEEGVGLVSLVHVNNEVGSINPLGRISPSIRSAGAKLHTDAVQSAGVMDLREIAQSVDFLTLSGHKMGGPKGVGVLMARERVESLLRGGPQERDQRAGTENVAVIVGFATALEIAQSDWSGRASDLESMRLRLAEGLLAQLGDAVRINTPMAESAPHILNCSFLQEGVGLDGEMLILGLDMEGVEVSAGSACSSGTVSPSHVLVAMGIAENVARGTVRFSLGWTTTQRDIEVAVDRIVRVVRRMRKD